MSNGIVCSIEHRFVVYLEATWRLSMMCSPEKRRALEEFCVCDLGTCEFEQRWINTLHVIPKAVLSWVFYGILLFLIHILSPKFVSACIYSSETSAFMKLEVVQPLQWVLKRIFDTGSEEMKLLTNLWKSRKIIFAMNYTLYFTLRLHENMRKFSKNNAG